MSGSSGYESRISLSLVSGVFGFSANPRSLIFERQPSWSALFFADFFLRTTTNVRIPTPIRANPSRLGCQWFMWVPLMSRTSTVMTERETRKEYPFFSRDEARWGSGGSCDMSKSFLQNNPSHSRNTTGARNDGGVDPSSARISWLDLDP